MSALRGSFPSGWDPAYFTTIAWDDRVEAWLAAQPGSFSKGNRAIARQMLQNADTGLRAVANIGTDALLNFLREKRYRNLYEKPVIGGVSPAVSQERLRVDAALEIGANTYFAAVALGGTGVRFYGEYCMVLGGQDPDTRLFDRDSYDILEEPLASLRLPGATLRSVLGGRWSRDVVAMAMMRVLPQIAHETRLVTSGTVSEAVLRDQEFIEVHMTRPFQLEDVEEVRQSPDDAAIEATITERSRQSRVGTLVELEWVRRRTAAAQALDERGVDRRVVTLHGRGYQWK